MSLNAERLSGHLFHVGGERSFADVRLADVMHSQIGSRRVVESYRRNELVSIMTLMVVAG